MVSFKRVCNCGERLEAAFLKEHNRIFWNCFKCFPHYERASKEQEKKLIEEFRTAGLLPEVKFKALAFNGLDDSAEIFDLDAQEEDEAYSEIEEGFGNYDIVTILNKSRLQNLIKVVEELK